MKHMKGGRVSRQNGVAIKIMKARIKGCFLLLTWIHKKVLFENQSLGAWMLSSLIPVYKGKDDLIASSFRGIKPFEHAFKLYEKGSGQQTEGNTRHRQNAVWFHVLKIDIRCSVYYEKIDLKAKSYFMYLLTQKRLLCEFKN